MGINSQSVTLLDRFSNKTSITVDFTSATWNTIATHELFTVTGLVRYLLVPRCTEDLTAGAGGTIKLGVEGATNYLIAATLFSLIDNGLIWMDATPSNRYAFTAGLDRLSNGADIGYEIETNAFTDGTMIFDCYWEAISDDGNVVAGAGGAL